MRKFKVLVIVNAAFGYDGISSVATNYYKYQDRSRVEMDLLTINPIFDDLARVIDANGDKSFVLDYRNRNPIKYVFQLRKVQNCCLTLPQYFQIIQHLQGLL